MTETAREKAAFAEWLARQHLRFDSRLTHAVYLPTGAPDDEVRLLEVNTGLYPVPGAPITAVETTPTVTDLPYRLCVADVTPEEWRCVQENPHLLPSGWRLEGKCIIQRSDERAQC